EEGGSVEDVYAESLIRALSLAVYQHSLLPPTHSAQSDDQLLAHAVSLAHHSHSFILQRHSATLNTDTNLQTALQLSAEAARLSRVYGAVPNGVFERQLA